jgi:hypothetical protein
MKKAFLSSLLFLLHGLAAVVATATDLVGTYQLKLVRDENGKAVAVPTRTTLKVTAKDATSPTATVYDISLSVARGNRLWGRATVQDEDGSTAMGPIASTRRASAFPAYERQVKEILASTETATLSSSNRLDLDGSQGRLRFRRLS